MWLFDLFRAKWKHSNYEVRKRAVKGLTDEELLIEIAKTDTSGEIREIATGKLSDQVALGEIAMMDEFWIVRQQATNRLTDQQVLAEIVKKDDNHHVREAALQKLTDQALLVDIAKTGDESARFLVCKKLTDQGMLADIADNSSNSRLRYLAAQKLADKILANKVYSALASNETNDSDIRSGAIDSLSETRNPETIALLIRILNDKNGRIVSNAVRALCKLGSIEAISPLISVLNTADDHDGRGGARREAAKALRKLAGEGTGEIVSALQYALQDRNEYVRDEASIALEMLNPDSQWGKLLKFLQRLKPSTKEVIEQLLSAKMFVNAKETLRDLQDAFDGLTRVVEVGQNSAETAVHIVYDNYLRSGASIAPATQQINIKVVTDGSKYYVEYDGRFL